MNTTIKDLKERRSIHKYKPEQITEEELNTVLEVGTYAPNGRGLQSPLIVAVQDKAIIAKLSVINANILGQSGFEPFYGAPTVIIVLADKNRPTYIEDGSLVLGNLMNAAHAIGLGSCWIHRAKEEFESDAGKALLREWGIGDNYIGIGHCTLGYIAGDLPKAKLRKDGYVIKIK
ncbi:Nitroreductase [Anaerocolumna jejuensis DSM 15929]|uniref:Nitroreductase n=1 Tax=Anaerocolumna jejuensis DSM 15929 TaxID=1121322 RepID=A0A1M7AMC9_9FIRM|nr:nitroreductase [Anaerocolumna jejuensis]SHL43825.1 Nitroreductase [Anaerocolumna jejuensis DSM 15929]